MLNITLFQSPTGVTLKNSYFNTLTRILTNPALGASGEIRTGDGGYAAVDLQEYIQAKFAGFDVNVQVNSSYQIISQVPAGQYYIIYSALPDANYSAANFTTFYNRIKALNKGFSSACLANRRLAFIFTNEPAPRAINIKNTTVRFIGEMLNLPKTTVGFMGISNPSNERWENSSVATLTKKLTFSTKPLPFSESKQELYEGAWVMKLKRPTYSNFNEVENDDFDGVVYSGNLTGSKKNIIGIRKSQFENPEEEDMDGIALFLEAGQYTVSCAATNASSNMLAPKIYPYLAETTSIYDGTDYSIASKCDQLNDTSKLNNEQCGPVNILLDGETDNYSFTLKKNGFVTFGIKNRYIQPQTNDSKLQSSYFGNYELRIYGTNIYDYNSSKFGSGKKDFFYSYPKPKCFQYASAEIELQPNRGKTLWDFIEQAKIDHPDDLVEYLNSQGYNLIYNLVDEKLEPFLPYITEDIAPISSGPLIATTYPVVINGKLVNFKMIVREQDYTLDYIPQEGQHVLVANEMQFVEQDGTNNGFWENTGELVKKEFIVYSLSTDAPAA